MAKVDLHPDFKDFFRSLNLKGVRYLLLGGYAVVHYGQRRTTDDIDIWIAISAENRERVTEAVNHFFGKSFLTPEILNQPGKVFKIGREPVRIDLLTGPSGVEFESCYERRRIVEMDGVQVSVISLEDLKSNKRSSGRAKDLADLENLPETERTSAMSRSKVSKPARRKKRKEN
jgi:predicted nucleotidyltransferase